MIHEWSQMGESFLRSFGEMSLHFSVSLAVIPKRDLKNDGPDANT